MGRTDSPVDLVTMDSLAPPVTPSQTAVLALDHLVLQGSPEVWVRWDQQADPATTADQVTTEVPECQVSPEDPVMTECLASLVALETPVDLENEESVLSIALSTEEFSLKMEPEEEDKMDDIVCFDSPNNKTSYYLHLIGNLLPDMKVS